MFERPDPTWYDVRDEPSAHVRLTYLGTAGFIVENADRTIVLDPYVSRPGLVATLTRPLVSDPKRVAETIPRADDVLVGHAHYDHILDAPMLCRLTGARLVGSRATCMVGRAAGLPESRLVETRGREDIASGSWRIRGIPSRHGRVYFGRVTLPGDITSPPPWPPRVHHLRHGDVLNWLVDTGGIRIAHVDSADVVVDELRGHRADVVCLCAIGRAYRPDYVEDVVRELDPEIIVPCHWDTMITPIDAPPELLPGVDLPGLLAEIRSFGVMPRLLPIRGRIDLGRRR